MLWLSDVESGKCGLAEAALGMGVSYRQARRLRKSYQERGDAGLVHGQPRRAVCPRQPRP